MKVLQEGSIWSVQVTCTGKGITGYGCGALLEANKEDIFKVYGGGYSESIPYTAIRCPSCKSDTCLEDMNITIPSKILMEAPDRSNWEKLNTSPERDWLAQTC